MNRPTSNCYTMPMKKAKHYVQLIVFDTLAVLCMIGALLTGWLPGPGGIPLFIIGLSLLAINHEWAERYIDMLREYADKVSDLIFIPKLRVFFDVLAVILLVSGLTLLIVRSVIWMTPLGAFCLGMFLLTFFGNRDRWGRLKRSVRSKH